MMNIKLATENRKETAQRLSEITGAEVLYTRAPRFAYEIGAYIIEAIVTSLSRQRMRTESV